ncbi:MAG: phosphoribosylamine--glycine ligase [Candidatus Dadabacteria bacterium]|nr:phosphoribosylamine--glycine ligase [Candidatus Dadabacteria bacterium]MCZ6554813.1 phosphoribosylamine--glycine ligase [Candidatus Dadabacteria bacterium]
MKVLVVGGGGREHALCWKISKSPIVKALFCAPGNVGISKHATSVDIKVTDIESMVRFARAEEIDLTVVGPEIPLSLGIVDRFQEENLNIFGPNKAAAEIESSKVYSKNLMKKYDIPTAFFSTFYDYGDAVNWVKEVKPPLVIKADGLAAGKGVIICHTEEESIYALDGIMRSKIFGDSGNRVVIEEFLQGEEVSFIAFTDGENVLPLASSQDHKALLDGDKGPNTGGMGAYSPAPIVTSELHEAIMNQVMIPTVRALKEEGRVYKGILYAGLMIEGTDIKVLEFNCRFGDPEAQPLLMRMRSDIVPIMRAISRGEVAEGEIQWYDQASVCVVMASKGYPGDYKKGFQIDRIDDVNDMDGVIVFHSGTSRDGSNIVANGGRVLGVTALGDNIPDAISTAYNAVNHIDCELLYFRTDIGKKALKYI